MQKSADGILNDTHDEGCSFLSEDEALDLKHDIAWGKYLYEYHTHGGITPITPALAATLSGRDLACLIIYPTPQMLNAPLASDLLKTLSVCIAELVRRQNQLAPTKE